MKTCDLNITQVNCLIKLFGAYEIMGRAKNTGFIKRNDGKLSPITFIKAFTLGILNNNNVSLQQIADKCEEIQEGLRITKEAIYQRLKAGSELMKEMFRLSMEYALDKVKTVSEIEVLKEFTNVYICDSTLVDVPSKLEDIFPSSGGCNPRGAIRIQAVYSIINRTFKKIDIFKGTANDQQYINEVVEMLKADELVIFDLGYFSKAALRNIQSKGAYFISRIAHNNSFYIAKSEINHGVRKINILEVLNKSNGIVDMEVFVGEGKEKRLKCRLVAAKLPEDVANERRRKAKKKAKGK